MASFLRNLVDFNWGQALPVPLRHAALRRAAALLGAPGAPGLARGLARARALRAAAAGLPVCVLLDQHPVFKAFI